MARTGRSRYGRPPPGEVQQRKYCCFKKARIKFMDYKDPELLKKFPNDQGKVLPRRITGNNLKFQHRMAQVAKRTRHLALLPFVADLMK